MDKSKIYTRRGDRGTTSLAGGTRVTKNDIRLEAYGTVDELNSFIGLMAVGLDVESELWPRVQRRLFDIGAYLATPGATECRGLTDEDVTELEGAIDRLDAALPPLRRFVLPGGCESAARAQVARTVCRRTERRIIGLCRHTDLDPKVLVWINRLSDLLFVVARTANMNSNTPEPLW